MCFAEPLVSWLFFSNIVSCTAFGMCAPFLPLEFERKGIPGIWIGLIFALYSVGSIFISPIIGKHAKNFEGKNLLGGSLGLMGVTFICFGFLEDLENRANIIVLGMFLRFFEGVCCAIHLVSNLAVGNKNFPHLKE